MKLTREVAEAAIDLWFNDCAQLLDLVRKVSHQPYGSVHTNEEWETMKQHCSLTPNTQLPQRLRVWVASHFVNASNALWDNNTSLALRWMVSGKDTTATTRPNVHARNEFKRAAGYKVIHARDLDKSSDWKTVK